MRERTDIIGRLVSAANAEQHLCQSDVQALLIEAAIELQTLRDRPQNAARPHVRAGQDFR